MTHRNAHPDGDARLDAYLDRALSADETADFERELQSSPALVADVALQTSIDQSLRRALTPPSADAIEAMVRRAIDEYESAPPAIVARLGRGRGLQVAAALFLIVVGAWMIARVAGTMMRPDGGEPAPWRSMAMVYDDAVDRDMEPEIICTTNQAFEDWFSAQFEQPLRLAEMPAETRALGLGYANTLSPYTMYVLATAADEPVLLFVDRLEHDAGAGSAEGDPLAGLAEDGLVAERRVIGRVVVYVVSRSGHPEMLDLLYDPTSPPETDR